MHIILQPIYSNYKPYNLVGTKYILSNIKVFDKSGIRIETGNGWFGVSRDANGVWKNSYFEGQFAPGIVCKRSMKRKPDFTLKEAFLVRSSDRNPPDGYKAVDLYLPIELLTLEVQKDFTYHQYEQERQMFDLYKLVDHGVGILVRGPVLPITQEQEDHLLFEKYVQDMDPQLSRITRQYTQDEENYHKQEKDLQQQIDTLTETIAALKKQRENLPRNFWIDNLLKPIVDEMLKDPRLAGLTADISGPFGMGARTDVFFKEGNESKYYLMFEPGKLRSGELYVVNAAVNTHRFQPGTLGELNGMNNPLMPMRKSVKALVDTMLDIHELQTTQYNFRMLPTVN